MNILLCETFLWGVSIQLCGIIKMYVRWCTIATFHMLKSGVTGIWIKLIENAANFVHQLKGLICIGLFVLGNNKKLEILHALLDAKFFFLQFSWNYFLLKIHYIKL